MQRICSFIACLLFVAFVISLSGCPDRSHQRAVPDYGSMTDQGSEIEGENPDGMRDE